MFIKLHLFYTKKEIYVRINKITSVLPDDEMEGSIVYIENHGQRVQESVEKIMSVLESIGTIKVEI